MRIIVSIILFAFGLFVLAFWAAGSHGHLQFRPDYLEDWVLTGLLVGCWGVPVFLFVYWIIKRRNQKSLR
jgi:hypothetical protein